MNIKENIWNNTNKVHFIDQINLCETMNRFYISFYVLCYGQYLETKNKHETLEVLHDITLR